MDDVYVVAGTTGAKAGHQFAMRTSDPDSEDLIRLPPASVLTLHLGTAPSRAPFMPQESGIGPPPLLRRHDDFGRFLVLAESRCEPTSATPASAAWQGRASNFADITAWDLTRGCPAS